MAAAGDVHRAGTQIQLLHRTAGDVGSGLIIPSERKLKVFHRAAGDMHRGGEVLCPQLVYRAAVQGQRAVVHGEEFNAAAAGHGERAGLILDRLAVLIKAGGADIDIIDALPVQVQRDIACDKRHIRRSLIARHFDIRQQPERAAAVRICVGDRLRIGGELRRRTTGRDRRLIGVFLRKYRCRQHGKHQNERQQDGYNALLPCGCCVHCFSPLHAFCDRRR